METIVSYRNTLPLPLRRAKRRAQRLDVISVSLPQGNGYRTAATVENVLSACGHKISRATAAAALTEIHYRRSMVLGWGGEWPGEFPDLSKRFAFEGSLSLPGACRRRGLSLR